MATSTGRGPPPPPPFRASIINVENEMANKCWVSEGPLEWSLLTVMQRKDGKVHLVNKKNVKVELNEEECLPVNSTVTEDMTSLHHLHEPGILFNLRRRYEQRLIYTYMASALIAVNPFMRIPDPNPVDFTVKPRSELQPHPNAISETCFKNLSVLKKNQSVVISGESGAGKTETAKIVIKYLASRSTDRGFSNNSTSDDGSDLYSKLQQLSPILESFGNARTGRNGNSSRFGKFMKLLFDMSAPASSSSARGTGGRGASGRGSKATLSGAMIETYMLEKSRVVYQSHGEGNFHIFYAILQQPPASLQIDPTIHFRMAANSKQVVLEPEHQLPAVTAAFKTLGLSSTTVTDLCRLLLGILYLGNVSFELHESAEGASAKITSLACDDNPRHSGLAFLKLAADTLAVDQAALRAMLTTREMETRGEKYTVPLTLREAEFVRDATAKAIYEALFQRIVHISNASLLQQQGSNTSARDLYERLEESAFIGVLDIFGFESFLINGFEQMLINFANEALQNTFNKQIFEKELQLFEEEKIDLTIGDCPTNQACVDMICAKTESIFAILDMVSRQPQPSDERFCEELHKCFAKKKAGSASHFGAVHRKDMRQVFIVHHYAAHVKYHVGKVALPSTSSHSSSNHHSDAPEIESAWIVKNNDSIPDALDALYMSSQLPVLRSLAAVHLAQGFQLDWSTFEHSQRPVAPTPGAAAGGSGGAPKRRKSVMMKPTIVATFSKSMQELNSMLDSTTCHFIRCIKPNLQLQPDAFDSSFVLEQMRALGILQACEVLKVSLPTRISYTEMKEALRTTVQRVQHLFTSDDVGEDVLLIASLLRAYQVPADAYRLGVHIAFFRSGQLSVLERLLSTIPSPSEEARIIADIEAMVTRYRTVTREVIRSKNQVELASENLVELEKKQSRLHEKMLLLPEYKGVDIPDQIALRVTTIEARMKQLRGRQTEHLKHLSNLEGMIEQFAQLPNRKPHNTSTKNVNSSTGVGPLVHHRNNITRLRECGDSLETILSTAAVDYQSISTMIDDLEEAQAKGDSRKLQSIVHDNDQLYEHIMDDLSTTEAKLAELSLHAERGQFDALSAQYDAIEETLQRVQRGSQDLRTGISVAQELLKEVEASVKLLDFAPIDRKLDHILVCLEQAQENTKQENLMFTNSAAELTADIAAAQAEMHAVPAPLPPTVTTSPASASEDASGGAKPRKSIVKYSLKDLADMKRAGSISVPQGGLALVGEDGKPIKPPRMSITVPTTTSSSSSAAAAALTSTSSAAAASPSQLPEPWKEYFDPKTSKPYYVNKATKERTWKRPVASAGATAAPLSASSKTPTTSTSAAAALFGRADTADDASETNSQPAFTPVKPTSSSGKNDNNTKKPLPPQWREVLDKKSGRYYYVHNETKERQWRRPEATDAGNRQSVGRGALATIAPISPEQGDPTTNRRISRKIEKAPERVSKRFDSRELQSALSEVENDTPERKPAAFKSSSTLRVMKHDDDEGLRHLAEIDELDRIEQLAATVEPVDNNFDDDDDGRMNTPSAADSKPKATTTTSSTPALRPVSSSFLTLKQEKVSRARRASTLIKNEAALVELELTETDKRSIAYLSRVGKQQFCGYLLKQSKLLGRWRKRYFVLDDQLLLYFDSEKEYQALSLQHQAFQHAVKNGKVLHLTGHSTATYTTTEKCFSISGEGEEEWYLLAQSDEDMDQWMRSLNAHIHIAYLTEVGLSETEDFWDQGLVSLQLWRVPRAVSAGSARRPVGIRTVPDVAGPRTGEGLFPGDVVEVVQCIEECDSAPRNDEDEDEEDDGENSRRVRQRYLRLAEDRGWVFEFHPTGHYSIMEPAGGTVHEFVGRYQYMKDNLESLVILPTPHVDHNDDAYNNEYRERMTNKQYMISPGEGFEGIAEWRVSPRQLYSSNSGNGYGDDEEDNADEEEVVFIKLRDGRGWVEMYHPVTGGQLCVRV